MLEVPGPVVEDWGDLFDPVLDYRPLHFQHLLVPGCSACFRVKLTKGIGDTGAADKGYAPVNNEEFSMVPMEQPMATEQTGRIIKLQLHSHLLQLKPLTATQTVGADGIEQATNLHATSTRMLQRLQPLPGAAARVH